MPTVITEDQLMTSMKYVKSYHDSNSSGGSGSGVSSDFAVQMVAATPNCYRRAELMTPNKTTITVHANTQVNINGKGYISTEDVELKLSDVVEESNRGGTDMYVYACEPESGTVPVFVVSPNSTVPDGYDADNSRKIGGFHCLCADVGEIDGHELSGYFRGEILPRSVWDLIHRAHSENEGMVFVEELNVWVDIYLSSYDGEKLVSEYGGSTVTGAAGGKYMHGEMFAEEFPKVKKRHIWRDEFLFFAKGSNELTSIQGGNAPGDTGGHVDTAGQRMISNCGVEDCCGVYWQWVGDVFGGGNSSALVKSSSSLSFSGCSYNDSARGTTIDGSTSYGQWYGDIGRILVGNRYGNTTYCGSRSALVYIFSSFAYSDGAGRGASGPRPVYTN